MKQVGGSYSTSATLTSGTAAIIGAGNLAVDASYDVVLTLTDTVGTVSTYSFTIPSAAYVMHVKKGGKAVGFGTAAGADQTVTFGWPVKLNTALEVSQGGTGAKNASSACANIGAVKKSGDTMTGNLSIQSSLYPSLYLLPTYDNTKNRIVFEGSYAGAASFSAWDDSSGNNRRMLEVRNASYESGRDNACSCATSSTAHITHSAFSTQAWQHPFPSPTAVRGVNGCGCAQEPGDHIYGQ